MEGYYSFDVEDYKTKEISLLATHRKEQRNVKESQISEKVLY